MPYIKQKARDEMGGPCGRVPLNAGELNYALTCIIQRYWLDFGLGAIEKRGYQAGNDIIGALEGAKLEFYRRTLAPYEDTKITENGDVSGFEVIDAPTCFTTPTADPTTWDNDVSNP